MTSTFDIFDTCLVRTCGSPHGVFSLMAQQLSTDKDYIRDFVLRRIQAERDAIRILHKATVTIEDIYHHFDATALHRTEAQLIALEMTIEEQVLRPVAAMREKINRLRSEGQPVIYISDMYLPSIFIKKILSKYHLWEEGDKLFLSCECNATKHSGSLYRHVSQVMRLRYKDWTHYGDNLRSDIHIPRRLGITTRQTAHAYSRYEKQWIAEAPSSDDSELLTCMAGCCRAVRTSVLTDERTNIAADVIAPAYIHFVFRIFHQAQTKRISHLYFTARDSHLFYCIAQKIAPLFPDIHLSYIRLSRRSLWLPSLYDCTREDFASFRHMEDYSPHELLTKMLQIPDDVLATCGQPLPSDRRLAKGGNASDFLQLLQHPQLHPHILHASAAARQRLIAYLLQEGLPQCAASAAIVDLGWGNTCRSSLNKILTREGYPPVHTFYFGIIPGYEPYTDDNPYSTTMVMEKHLHPVAPFEHYFSLTDQQTTIGYVDDGGTMQPLFGNPPKDMPAAARIASLHQEVVLAVADLLLQLPGIERRFAAIRPCAQQAMELFLQQPQRRELAVLREVSVYDLDGKYPLIHRRLPLTLLRRLVGMPHGKVPWLGAAIVASFPVGGRLLCRLLVWWLRSGSAQRALRLWKRVFH